MKYSVDTSAFMDGWARYYPPDVFPHLWERLESLTGAGHLRASGEVLLELERKTDDLLEWVKAQSGLFVPLDEATQRKASEVLERFPLLIDANRGRSGADPFVIGLAMARDCIVVTGERKASSLRRPRVPDVCEALGVECIPLVELIRKEGWRWEA